MKSNHFKHIDYSRYPRHRTPREYYMHNRIVIDALGSAAGILVLALGLVTTGIGWTVGMPIVKACGSVAALLGFVGVIVCESGRG